MPAASLGAGYSGKPLFQKMGLKPGMVCRVISPPDHFESLMAGCVGVEFRHTHGNANCVHLFCRDRAALEQGWEAAVGEVNPSGMLWVSWPKKKSALFIDLTEDVLREIILPSGWVDIKVCAVDQDWSGLKFVKRRS